MTLFYTDHVAKDVLDRLTRLIDHVDAPPDGLVDQVQLAVSLDVSG